ncbi:MAG: BatA domain-containing protein [Alphaproteobacteria bacterium]|nr:BatA domain-containing protein [Alphaproteobacteria bacterium]
MNAGALAALATLAIPILIHLFNRSPGQRVVVGSIKLIRHAKSRRVTEIRLMHYLLLFLRLLIFTLLALILAGLSMQATSNLDKDQAYVTPAWAELASDEEKQSLNDRFGAENTHTLQAPIWAQLIEQLTSVKHSGEVHVYATNASGAFGPQMGSAQWPLVWHLRPETEAAVPAIKLAITMVATRERQPEADQLIKALTLMGEHRNIETTLRTLGADGFDAGSTQDTDWIIWLGPKAVLESQLGALPPGTNVLLAPKAEAGSSSPAATLPGYPFSAYSPINPVQPFLQNTVLGGNLVHTLNAPLLGQNAIIAKPDFPEILTEILLSDELGEARFSNSPVLVPQSGDNWPNVSYPQAPLEGWLIVLLVIAWVFERWLSERGPRRNG